MKLSLFVPATIGNIGPGFDVLGLAIGGLGDIFHFDFESDIRSIKVSGKDKNLVPVDPEKNAAAIALSMLTSKACAIEIDRSIPISAGLGSSAAACIAGAYAGALYLGINDEHKILGAALEAQASFAGYQLDNIAPCFYGGITLVHHVHPIDILQPSWVDRFWLGIYIPSFKYDIKYSRALLPNQLNNELWVQQMAHMGGVLIGFQKGDAEILKRSLVDGFAEPQRASIIPCFYEARKIAVENGALNFNISGSGPTCFSFFESEKQAKIVTSKVMEELQHECTVYINKVSDKGATHLTR